MDRIDAARTIDGQAAVFLRYGPAGYVVVAAVGGERTIEHAARVALLFGCRLLQKPIDLGSSFNRAAHRLDAGYISFD
jgi:hypothetical protein